jgi:hypothetical protein
MTEKEFILEHEHELMGLIIDAHVLNLEGAFRAKRLQELLQKVRSRLTAMYRQLAKDIPPSQAPLASPIPSNGAAGKPFDPPLRRKP